jgi:hypothetical protein
MSVRYSNGVLVVQIAVQRGDQLFSLVATEGIEMPLAGQRDSLFMEDDCTDTFQSVLDHWDA